MRKYFYLLVVACFCGVGLWFILTQEDGTPEGAIVADREIGPLFPPEEGMTIEEVLYVQNPSEDETMTLELVRQTCNCLELILEQPRIDPGCTGRIGVRVTVASRTGATKVGMQLATGLTEKPDLFVRLLIRTHVRIATDPARFPTLEIHPGSEEVVPFDVIVRQPLEDARVPIRLESESDWLTLTPLDQREEDREGVRVITAHCRATIRSAEMDEGAWADNSVQGKIVIRHGGSSAARTIRWLPRSVIAVEPKRLFLQTAAHGTAERLVCLEATEPFAIQSITTDSSFIQVDGDLGEAKKHHQLNVRVSGDGMAEIPPAGRGTIRLSTDHPDQKTLKLPVFVLWVGAARTNTDLRADQIP